MKNNIKIQSLFILILLFSTNVKSQEIFTINPSFERTNATSVIIKKIKITDNKTIVTITYDPKKKNTWIKISSNTTISPVGSYDYFKILALINPLNGAIIPLDTQLNCRKGYVYEFSLVFPKLQENIEFINLTENSDGGWFWKKIRINNNSVISKNQNISINSDWKGNGTGFFIDKNGYIATNYHVVQDANDIEVEFIRNGIKQIYSAKVIQSDKQNDLSIIKINSSGFKPFLNLPFNFKANISDVGSNIFALGYPMALSLMGTEIKFTDGKISSKTGMQGDITSYQISVPIQPGNSGGPLFDYDGNLIGITTSTINRKYDITENVNYAIKSSYLKNLVDVLDYKLTLPSDKLIANKTLTEKIKILSDYVVLIKIK